MKVSLKTCGYNYSSLLSAAGFGGYARKGTMGAHLIKLYIELWSKSLTTTIKVPTLLLFEKYDKFIEPKVGTLFVEEYI